MSRLLVRLPEFRLGFNFRVVMIVTDLSINEISVNFDICWHSFRNFRQKLT